MMLSENNKVIKILFCSVLTVFLSATLLARKGDVFSVGEKIMAKHNGTWVRAEVKKKNDESYYIHYIGKSEDDDVWVTVYQMEKMAKFGSNFSTSKKNTRFYKIRSEIEYFCKKEVEFKKARGKKAKQMFQACAKNKMSLAKTKTPPPITRFDPARPLDFDIHQACMGGYNTFCADKCGEHSAVFCLPQCLESVQRCKNTFWYDVDLNKHCNDKGAAEWQMNNYNKNFNKGGRSIWILPNVYFDDRKDKGLYSCSVRHAKRMSKRNDCVQLERCTAVCQIDPQSQKKKTVKSCQRQCRKWFPKRRCKSFVKYRF